MASGELSEAEFTRFLSTAFEQLCAFSRLGSVHFICIDWRHLRELLSAGKDIYGVLANLCVWIKSNGGSVLEMQEKALTKQFNRG